MKKNLLAAASFLVLGLALADTAAAQPVPYTTRSNLIAQLEPIVETCDWKVRTLTGGPKDVMLVHNTKMKKILDDVRTGKSVDPKDIDEVMQMHALESGQLLSP